MGDGNSVDRSLQVERFPEDLRRRLRVLAAERGTTLRELVIAACVQAYPEGPPLLRHDPPPLPSGHRGHVF